MNGDTFKDLQVLWAAQHKWSVVGFRDDMRDIRHWVCYCRHNQPVPYEFFNRMQCAQVKLPTYSDEQITQAVEDLPEGEAKSLLKSHAQTLHR